MNNKQRARLDAANRVFQFNKKYAAETSTISGYSDEEKDFTANLDIVIAASQVQAGTAGAQTDATDIAKAVMAKTVTKYIKRAVVQAKRIKEITLANQLNHPITYIASAAKTLAVNRATDLRTLLNDNLPKLTCITAGNIAEIDDAIAAYNALKDVPTLAVQNRAAYGTDPLPAAFDAMTAAIDNMFSLVESYFEESNKPMVEEFALAKQIIVTGVHHTGIEGTVLQGDKAVASAVVSIVGTEKAATTDAFGHYAIIKLKAGDYVVEVRIDGVVHSAPVHISRGMIETLDFTV